MLISPSALGDVAEQLAAADVPPDLTPTLVGALLGLVAALLIQVVVVPAIQARAKRQERWQAAISEMAALVAVDFERAISRYRFAASVALHHPEYREAARHRGDAEAQKLLAQVVKRDNDERRAADDALDELVSCVVRLQGQVLQRLSDEDSKSLINLVVHLRLKTFLLTAELVVHPEEATEDRIVELPASQDRRATRSNSSWPRSRSGSQSPVRCVTRRAAGSDN